jgi:acyl carrier protein
MMPAIDQLRTFVTENLLIGQPEGFLKDDMSFLENGIIDSTGLLELIGFVERTYDIKLADEELIPDNLDSLEKVAQFLSRRLAPLEEDLFQVSNL